jgi:hypothetical protein
VNPIVAAWRVPTVNASDCYEAVCADGSVWRYRTGYATADGGDYVPDTGWFRVIPPLTEIDTNAKEV